MTLAACLLALSLSPARAEQTAAVRRGTLALRVQVNGTVVPADIVRLKATIDGRVEDILTPDGGWAYAGHPIGHLANREMAALLDAHQTTEKGVLEQRWREVYQPTEIMCPRDCYLMRTYVKPRDWVRARALLFEAAQELRLVARVRPEDAQWIHDGQKVVFWDARHQERKQMGAVTHFLLDVQGERAAPGATFYIEGTPQVFLPPGTQWEGEIVPVVKHDVLIAPTNALIQFEGSVYLPVKVSTGITTPGLTEITAGTDEGREVLVIDDSRLKDAAKHKMDAEVDAILRAHQDDQAGPAQVQIQAPPPAPKPAPAPLQDPDAVYGGDPYGQ